MTYDLIVVGAGPAGHAAATAYREAGGAGDVLLLAGEGREPYRRPPLSKELLRGELEPDALALAAEPGAYDALGITLRHGTARSLHPAERRVALDDATSVSYRHCVLATGAQPVRPPLPGAHLPGVHVLRTVADALALRHAAQPGARVLVLGSGFIGCEAAASLRARGCRVALITRETAPQRDRLGAEVAERLAGWLDHDGIDARYDQELLRIERDADGTLHATASDGATIPADLILLAGGVAPDTAPARAAGLAVDEASGLIRAGADLRTSAPTVLACGDCALAHHAVAERPLHVEHWGDALAQGAVAGATAAGREARWDTVPGFWSAIGQRTLKHAAWGDGFAAVDVVQHGDGAFTAWYADDARRCVGVLTHDRDGDFEAGRRMVAEGAVRA